MAANEFLPQHARLIDAFEKHTRLRALVWFALPVLAVGLFAFLIPASESARRDPTSTVAQKNLLAAEEPTTPSLRAALGLAPAAVPQLTPPVGTEAPTNDAGLAQSTTIAPTIVQRRAIRALEPRPTQPRAPEPREHAWPQPTPGLSAAPVPAAPVVASAPAISVISSAAVSSTPLAVAGPVPMLHVQQPRLEVQTATASPARVETERSPAPLAAAEASPARDKPANPAD